MRSIKNQIFNEDKQQTTKSISWKNFTGHLRMPQLHCTSMTLETNGWHKSGPLKS